MNQFRVMFAIALLFSSIVAHATTLKFTGPAAKTLFICEFFGNMDCWYAEGTNFCLIHNFDDFEILPGIVRIHGKVASTVSNLIRNCHDGSAYESRHYYGGETGIKCRYHVSNGGLWCDLPIDSYRIF